MEDNYRHYHGGAGLAGDHHCFGGTTQIKEKCEQSIEGITTYPEVLVNLLATSLGCCCWAATLGPGSRVSPTKNSAVACLDEFYSEAHIATIGLSACRKR